MSTKKLSIKKKVEDLTASIPADENDDFRKLLREEMIIYFTAGAGRDLLKSLTRSIVRDELYGGGEGEDAEPQCSTATSSEIKKLIRLELYGEDKPE